MPVLQDAHSVGDRFSYLLLKPASHTCEFRLPQESKTHKRVRAQEIEKRLFAVYGPGKPSLNYTTPFTLTVAVVLSAQCTDEAVNKVTPELFATFPTPQDLAEAPLKDIEKIIHPLGFFRSKAEKLKGLAQISVAEYGGSVPADIDELQKLPGVGRKTANCVMVESFGEAHGIAVDTHVFRIAHRLQIVPKAANTPEKVEAKLMELFDQKDWGYINHQLVWFGREYCQAKKPQCETCPLSDLCPSAFL